MTARLPSGEMRPTAGARRTASRSCAGSVGSVSPFSGAAEPVTPASRAIAAAVAGASPESTLSTTSSLEKNATVSAAFGRSRSASTTRPSGRTSAGRDVSPRSSGKRLLAASQRQHAAARRRLLRSALPQRLVCDRETLRRPEIQALAVEVQRAPAPARGERHLRLHAGVGGLLQPCVVDGVERQVPRGRTGREARQLVRERRAVGPRGRHERDHARLGLGERARLVRAHDIDRRERLDRVQLLREHAALRDLVRRDGGGEVDQQDQPLRHEADEPAVIAWIPASWE